MVTIPSTPASLEALVTAGRNDSWPDVTASTRVVTGPPAWGLLTVAKLMAVGPPGALARMPKVSNTRLPPVVVVTEMVLDTTMPICPVVALTVVIGADHVLVTVPWLIVGAENTAGS